MTYTLPKSVEIGSVEYSIRWDYRPILDICVALSDPELSGQDRGYVALTIFYPDFDDIPQIHYQEAIEKLFWFVNCGEEASKQKNPRLVDWEKDFPLIASPVNRVLGLDIRAANPTHWWTFIGAYQEIGDCTFAQVVRIRDQKARGKPLDKMDRAWYRRNRHLVDFSSKYTSSEMDLMKAMSGG